MWIKKAIIAILIVLFAGEAFAATYVLDAKNMTKGSALAGYPVTVKALKLGPGAKPHVLDTAETRTDGDGFSRGEIDAPAGSAVVAEVSYRGVTYRSDPELVGRAEESLDISIPVYEITDRRDGVSIPSRRMIILVKNDRTLEVIETLTVENKGAHTYVGKFNDDLGMNQVLYIPMPRGFVLTGFSGNGEPRIRTSGMSILTQNEVLPGTMEINMHYYVQSDIGSFDMSLYTEKDTPKIQLMTLFTPTDEAWKFKPSGLRKAGSREIGDRTYTVWKGRPESVTNIEAYGPGYRGGLSVWHASIVLAFAISAAALYFSRGYVGDWRLVREEKRLLRLREQAGGYAGATGEYLRPFAAAIDGRLGEIRDELGED